MRRVPFPFSSGDIIFFRVVVLCIDVGIGVFVCVTVAATAVAVDVDGITCTII